MKVCSKCETAKPLFEYHSTKKGLSAHCKACDAEKHRKWRTENPAKFRSGVDAWQLKNKERLSAYQAVYAKDNKGKKQASLQAYRATQLRAVPKWANFPAIESIYAQCPAGKEVDHIVPLRSPIVCGLHCEQNLQHLLLEENRSKSNRYWPTMSSDEVQEATRFYEKLGALIESEV